MALRLVTEATGVVYTPPETNRRPGAMYPRVICLEHSGDSNGTLLATFEQYTAPNPVFPIYVSRDNGLTWSLLSEVRDTHNGWGNKFQPHLFEFPCRLGDLPEGTIMIAGNSIPDNGGSTELVTYISRDHGKTWEFRSSIVKGGLSRVNTQDGPRPVWEPYLYLDAAGDLVCYYSDERFFSDGYNQLLSYQVSKDGGKTWGEEIYNVAIPDGKMRPGMPIVVRLPDGNYFMSYEMVGLPRWDVNFKISPDGLDWGDPADPGTRAETADGLFLGSTPYCLWVPQGGPEGTVIVAGRREGEGDCIRNPGYFHVNYHCGKGPWERIPMPISHDSRLGFTGYSQSMCLIENGTKLIHLCPVQISPQKAQISYAVCRLETV